MRPLIAFLALVLAGCATSRATAPDLTLAERFEIVALRDDDGRQRDRLFRWDRPISVHYIGPEDYRQDVYDHATLLGELTGKPVVIEGAFSALTVEISDEDTGMTCMARVHTTEPGRVHIWSGLPPNHIRSCVVEELSQSMGLPGDLDGVFGSRADSAFASWGGSSTLTESDIAMIHILYDRRLHHGMPRAEVLAILPAIIADLYPEEAAR